MELEIHTETGSILKPVMNAAKRTLKTGIVEVDEDGLRICGLGPAVVALDVVRKKFGVGPGGSATEDEAGD